MRISFEFDWSFLLRYMKGRESLEDMQQFLDTVIIQSFTAKYALLPKRREAVPQADLHFWTLYKSQEEYFRGKFHPIRSNACPACVAYFDSVAYCDMFCLIVSRHVGCKFITQGDICQMTNKQIDKKTANRITVLRHLKIIREERKNAAICYIWNKESGAQRRWSLAAISYGGKLSPTSGMNVPSTKWLCQHNIFSFICSSDQSRDLFILNLLIWMSFLYNMSRLSMHQRCASRSMFNSSSMLLW